MTYAGFGIRFAALIIDAVVLGIVVAILSLVNITSMTDPSASGTIIQTLISFVYFITFTATTGQTLGKMALGIMVVDANGGKLTVGKAILRETVGKFVSFVTIFIGFIIVAFDAKNQGFHDKIASSFTSSPQASPASCRATSGDPCPIAGIGS